jgi:hypothetical protein
MPPEVTPQKRLPAICKRVATQPVQCEQTAAPRRRRPTTSAYPLNKSAVLAAGCSEAESR